MRHKHTDTKNEPCDSEHCISCVTEALSWLNATIENKDFNAFAANYFGETEAAINFVKRLYECGAERVDLEKVDDDYADTFFVYLPAGASKIIDIMELVMSNHPDEIDGDWHSAGPIRLWWD